MFISLPHSLMFPSNDPWPWLAAFHPKTNFAHLLNNEKEKCGGISGTHWLKLHEVLLNLSGNSVNYKIGCSAENLLSTTSLAFHLKWNIKSLIVELHTNNAKHLLKHLSQADRKELLRRKCVWSAPHVTKHIKIAYWKKNKKKKWEDALWRQRFLEWCLTCSHLLSMTCSLFLLPELLFESHSGTNSGVGYDLFFQVCQIFPDLFSTVLLFSFF